MRILTHQEITGLKIESTEYYRWGLNVLKSKNDVILPAKISMKPKEDIFYNVMPTLLPKNNIGGVKIVNRYPDRKPTLDSQILLYNYKTGQLKSLLDGNYITAIRTAVIATHSIREFGIQNFSKLGIIGLGNTARATLKILLSVYENKNIKLKLLKYKSQHLLFKDYVSNLEHSNNITFVMCDSYEETVQNSDVILSSATYLPDNICNDNVFKKGCLVIPVHTRGFMNCDLFFDKVFADDTNHVKEFKYFNRFRKFSEVTDVVKGITKGRENNKERIIVYNIGLSMYDIYFAEKIYNIAVSRQTGKNIELGGPEDKFWI